MRIIPYEWRRALTMLVLLTVFCLGVGMVALGVAGVLKAVLSAGAAECGASQEGADR